MKATKIIAMLLTGALGCSLFAGCGAATESEEQTQNIASAAEETAQESTFEGFDTLQTIDMYGMSFFGDDGLTEVMDEINAISEEQINVHVNYNPLDIASYMQQVGLMLSGGEAYDLTLVTSIPVVSFSTMTAQNELMDITDYIDEYAPQLKEKLGFYMDATTLNDSVYAVPCYRQYNSSLYIFMREDILDELGLTEQARAIQSWSDYEAIMMAVKEAQDNGQLPEEMKVNAMICNADSQGTVINSGYCNTGAEQLADTHGYDGLGDNNKIIYVDENGKVGNYFETEDYRASVERVNRWYNEGLVYKDAATSADGSDALMMSGTTFSFVGQAEYGAEAVKEMQCQKPLVAVKVCDIPVQTANGNSWGWAVPTTNR